MDEARVEALGTARSRASRRDRRASTACWIWRPSWAASSGRGGGGIFGSFVDTDDRDSDRYLVNITQGGLDSLMSPTTAKRSSRRSVTKYVDYLETLLTLAERPDPAGTAETVFALEKRITRGALGTCR